MFGTFDLSSASAPSPAPTLVAAPLPARASKTVETPREIEQRIRARYDAAQTTPDNRRHWQNTDAFSARTANSLPVRKTLRERARYEISNNCWARGIVNRWANYLIGTGPRLQILTTDRADNSALESQWNDWAREIRLTELLHTAAKAKIGDGESFFLARTSPELEHPVKFDLQEIECDQVTTLVTRDVTARFVDGIDLDNRGRPVTYHLLDNHPGDPFGGGELTFTPYAAKYVYHWFRQDRPGQVRGISELTPGLDLFGQLRRYGDATLSAAELAAMMAMTIESTLPVGEAYPLDPFQQEYLEKLMIVNLPEGWSQKQMKPEHPTTMYDMFVRSRLRELAAALDIPFGLAIGDFSGYNYSSGRLDIQSFSVVLRTTRRHLVTAILERVLCEWLAEAMLIPGLIPQAFQGLRLSLIPHTWHWDGLPHVDPVKEAQARKIKVDNNMMTLADVYAEDGKDWEPNLRQRGQEVKLENELGIKLLQPGAMPPAPGTDPSAPATPDEEEEAGNE